MTLRHTFSPFGTLLVCITILLGLTQQPAAAAGTTLLGVYYGNQGWKMEQVQALESWQSKKHAVVNMFTDWCNQTKTMDNLFGQQLPNIWNNKNVPMVTWEPYICTTAGTTNDVEVRIARGEYDAYVKSWAGRLKQFVSGPDAVYGTSDDRRVYLRLAHEMNGDWYPWSAVVGSNSPTDYITMWRHVHAVFASQGLDNTRVQWVWAVNHDDVGGFTAEQYYPGDAYVDWIGIDGYNWGATQTWSTWKTPAQAYDGIVGRLRAISAKPLTMTEAASTSSTTGGVNLAAKSQWIADFYAYITAKDIRMVLWFNEDKETDWAIFGGVNGDTTYKYARTTYKAYASYKTAVAPASFVPADSMNPRLLTDLQFAGQ